MQRLLFWKKFPLDKIQVEIFWVIYRSYTPVDFASGWRKIPNTFWIGSSGGQILFCQPKPTLLYSSVGPKRSVFSTLVVSCWLVSWLVPVPSWHPWWPWHVPWPKVKIDGLPIPSQIGYLKGVIINQYVGECAIYLFNYCTSYYSERLVL